MFYQKKFLRLGRPREIRVAAPSTLRPESVKLVGGNEVHVAKLASADEPAINVLSHSVSLHLEMLGCLFASEESWNRHCAASILFRCHGHAPNRIYLRDNCKRKSAAMGDTDPTSRAHHRRRFLELPNVARSVNLYDSYNEAAFMRSRASHQLRSSTKGSSRTLLEPLAICATPSLDSRCRNADALRNLAAVVVDCGAGNAQLFRGQLGSVTIGNRGADFPLPVGEKQHIRRDLLGQSEDAGLPEVDWIEPRSPAAGSRHVHVVLLVGFRREAPQENVFAAQPLVSLDAIPGQLADEIGLRKSGSNHRYPEDAAFRVIENYTSH